MPDAIQILREEHAKIRSLFEQFRDARDADTRKAIADDVVAEIETHTLLEQDMVYPAIRRAAHDEDCVNAASEQHREAERLAEELEEADPAADEFAGLFSELAQRFSNHMREEEDELFPHLEALGDEELMALGHKLEDREKRAMTELQDHGPQAPASIESQAD